jgi:hypothetical protein
MSAVSPVSSRLRSAATPGRIAAAAAVGFSVIAAFQAALALGAPFERPLSAVRTADSFRRRCA